MPEEYREEMQDTAEDLYVTEGLTYDQVSKAVEVSVSTLKRWGRERGWKEARKEHRADQRSVRRLQVKLRAAWLRKAVSSEDPQAVYAYAAIEKALSAGKKAAPVEPEHPQVTEKVRDIATPGDAVAALKDVVEMKLNRLLSQPETLKMAQIKEVKESLGLIEKMKAKYSPEEMSQAQEGFDADQVELIREALRRE